MFAMLFFGERVNYDIMKIVESEVIFAFRQNSSNCFIKDPWGILKTERASYPFV